VIWIKRAASMHWQSIILIRENVHSFINNGVHYDQQTTSLTLMKLANWFLKNVQAFTFISSYSFYVSMHSNNILYGPCLKLP